MSLNDSQEKLHRPQKRAALRFILGVPVIFCYFLLLILGLKILFISGNWSNLRVTSYGSITFGLWKGLRFDAAVLSYLLVPAFLIYYTAALVRWHSLRLMFQVYLVLVSLLITLISLIDLQYFEEAGKHLTYEPMAYVNLSALPIISGAFRLHPWLSSISLLACIGVAVVTAWIFKGLAAVCISAREGHHPTYLLTFPLVLSAIIVAGRGGFQGRPFLRIGDSCISPNPYINALCLNPVYSTLWTAIRSRQELPGFFNEQGNIRTIQDLLGYSRSSPVSSRYPLIRFSPGTGQGNRKNIVIFVLESWSGKDVGCLGSKAGVTPFFDDLARSGLLFTRCYANGIRTAEGLFSIFCSFPNQPILPILDRSTVFQTRWSSLSQILTDVGYQNIFIHGRSLEFDKVREFLQYIHFHKIIDRHNFPSTTPLTMDSWAGYDDEEVMRLADEEFAGEKGPFLGVIYTMNTHPPFVTPKHFQPVFEPSNPSNRFLNALRYSDHALKIFFNLARTRPYFQNTIFLFVADHARTRERFTLADQHHIPLLIYSPDTVQPGVNPVVCSQVDILPTILGLLQLKVRHASWGRDLFRLPRNQGFAVNVVGDELRWHDSNWLLADGRTKQHPLLFDTVIDPTCTQDIWVKEPMVGKSLRNKLRAYIALSQTLLIQNRVYPYEKNETEKEGLD